MPNMEYGYYFKCSFCDQAHFDVSSARSCEKSHKSDLKKEAQEAINWITCNYLIGGPALYRIQNYIDNSEEVK